MKKKIENMRNVFLLAFLFLIVTIIFTPLIVKTGFYLFAEETFEAILLLIQISVAWNIFRLYERALKGRETEMNVLEGEYQKREKELLDAFRYLGKVNVQISLIKSLIQKAKTPVNKKDVKEYFEEILKVVLSVSKKKWAMMWIIDVKSFKTIAEHSAALPGGKANGGVRISNKEIMKHTDCRKDAESGYFICSSRHGTDRFAFRIFIILPGEGEPIEKDAEEFILAAINQCKMFFALFSFSAGAKGTVVAVA
jgi:hypothetical protein